MPEDKAAKNHVHLDVRAAPGFEPGPTEVGLIVMQDPAGNEFCLDQEVSILVSRPRDAALGGTMGE